MMTGLRVIGPRARAAKVAAPTARGFDVDHDDWGQIRRVHFVDRVISVGEIPVRIPDQQLDIIHTAEARPPIRSR
jgi:hypothetical protein